MKDALAFIGLLTVVGFTLCAGTLLVVAWQARRNARAFRDESQGTS